MCVVLTLLSLLLVEKYSLTLQKYKHKLYLIEGNRLDPLGALSLCVNGSTTVGDKRIESNKRKHR